MQESKFVIDRKLIPENPQETNVKRIKLLIHLYKISIKKFSTYTSANLGSIPDLKIYLILD